MKDQTVSAYFHQAAGVTNLPPHFVADFLERHIMAGLRPFVASGQPFAVNIQASGAREHEDGSVTHFRAVRVRVSQ